MYVVYKISSGDRNSPLDDNTARSITRFVPSLLLDETKCLWHWNYVSKAQCVTGAHVGLQSPGYLEGRLKKRFQEVTRSDWEGLMGIAWDFKFCPESLEGLMKNFKQENHMIKSVFHKGNHLAIWKKQSYHDQWAQLSRKSCLWAHMWNTNKIPCLDYDYDRVHLCV